MSFLKADCEAIALTVKGGAGVRTDNDTSESVEPRKQRNLASMPASLHNSPAIPDHARVHTKRSRTLSNASSQCTENVHFVQRLNAWSCPQWCLHRSLAPHSP